ncbi:hypothetical protein LOC51_09310 [Rubrivivax sp. JA1024]|nr:hypothetical protein [Rubrivivax sp. JA1024]
METVKAFCVQLSGSAIGIVFLLVGTLGWAYWMWIAIKLGSFNRSSMILQCFAPRGKRRSILGGCVLDGMKAP